MLSTGSQETTFLDHKLKKATRQQLICLSSWAIFELVIHRVRLINISFSQPFQPPSLTSRGLQNSTITRRTLQDEKCHYCCQKTQLIPPLGTQTALNFQKLCKTKEQLLYWTKLCVDSLQQLMMAFGCVFFLLKASNVCLGPHQKSSDHYMYFHNMSLKLVFFSKFCSNLLQSKTFPLWSQDVSGISSVILNYNYKKLFFEVFLRFICLPRTQKQLNKASSYKVSSP